MSPNSAPVLPDPSGGGRLPGFGGSSHEFYARITADAVSCAGLALGLAAQSSGGPLLWVRLAPFAAETGMPDAPGLAEFGLDPSRLILARVRDVRSALQAGLEGARCGALRGVFIELWGETRLYDLTASRRLALAAKASGVAVFVSRIAAEPVPSAAQTRWLMRAAPSRALAARAPGRPAFELVLLRARNGQAGLRYQLEWDRDAGRLIHRAIVAGLGTGSADPGDPRASPFRGDGSGAALPGLVVPVPVDRPGAAPDEAAPWRRAG
jgi:protein ImuA